MIVARLAKSWTLKWNKFEAWCMASHCIQRIHMLFFFFNLRWNSSIPFMAFLYQKFCSHRQKIRESQPKKEVAVNRSRASTTDLRPLDSGQKSWNLKGSALPPSNMETKRKRVCWMLKKSEFHSLRVEGVFETSKWSEFLAQDWRLKYTHEMTSARPFLACWM